MVCQFNSEFVVPFVWYLSLHDTLHRKLDADQFSVLALLPYVATFRLPLRLFLVFYYETMLLLAITISSR